MSQGRPRLAGLALLVLAASECATPTSEPPASGAKPSPPAASDHGEADGSAYRPTPGVLHEHQTLEVGSTTRDYHFYEAGGQPGQRRPLVLVLHGGFAKIDAFIGKPRGAAPLAGVWLELAERHGVHVAIPQATDPGKGPHWNDCRADCSHCGDQDDVAFLVQLVRSLSERYPVDPDRVYVCGESNGGFMTLRLAQEQPGAFAAFGVVSALMPADSECGPPRAPASVAFVVGTEDRAVRYDGGPAPLAASGSVVSAGDSVAAWTAVARCEGHPAEERLDDLDRRDGSTVTRARFACERGHEVMLLTAHGGGHVVPSTSQRVSRMWESVVGRQNHDLETAAELWRFFEAHPRDRGSEATTAGR